MRLLSPTHRRIYNSTEDAASIVIASQLQTVFGWRPYTGPAQTDKRGWVILDTDPNVSPKPVLPRRYPKPA